MNTERIAEKGVATATRYILIITHRLRNNTYLDLIIVLVDIGTQVIQPYQSEFSAIG